SESPIKNFFQGENWTAYGNPTINKNALQLDGSSYIQSGEIELGGQDFTVDGWCYTDPNCAEGARVFNIHLSPDTGNTLVKLRHPAGSSNWRLITNTVARVGGNTNSQDSGINPAGELHHFAVVYQYTEKIMTFYVDGVKKARRTSCPQYKRQKFIVDVGNQKFSSTENYFFTGSVDEFRIYDGVALWTENFTPPTADDYKNFEIDFNFDAERKIKNPALTWRYENYGTADLLTVDGTTLSNLPKTQSKSGSAFYQTARQKCFDIPSTKEIWIKFDVFTTLSNRWRAYNDATGSASDGICSQTNGSLSVWADTINIKDFSNALKNQLQTFLLHMKADSQKGILEVWQDGEKIYTFLGSVNGGNNFEDFYLQSDGSKTFFSNVIISNDEIGLNEDAQLFGVQQDFCFDVERIIENKILIAKINSATKILLHFDDDSYPFKDECGNNWTPQNNPVITSENAKFEKALQFDSDEQFLTLDGEIELGGKDFSVAGWIFVPADFNDSKRKIFSIGNLIKFGFYTITSGDWHLVLSAWINTNSTANSDLSGYALTTDINPCGQLLHFEIDYDYNEKTVQIFINGIQKFKRDDCPQYERNNFSIKIGNFIGTLDEFRVVDGYKLHSKNFSPPSVPYNLTERTIEQNFDSERRIFNHIEKNFDVERKIFHSVEYFFDTERILNYSVEVQEFSFDTERKLFAGLNLNFDTERKIPHNISNFDGIFQEVQIEIATQQLTDRLTFTGVHSAEILEQIKGKYLDYNFDVRVEEITKRGILKTLQCCSDIDEILYTQLDYKIQKDFVCYTIDYTTGNLREAGGWVLPDNFNGEIIKKAYASSHLTLIAQAIGKELIMRFDDFVSDMEIEQKNVTYADLLNNLFGWTSRLPQMMINCFCRDGKLFVVQRGFEKSLVDLTNTEHTIPTIHKSLVRTTWGSAADLNFTVTRHQGGWYVYPPPRGVSDDGKTNYYYRRVEPHGYLLTG
ncbi:MAG: laminin G domain-containing protein, partial [Selenomonadaceae bacterium]|nr:laminin G domain-containing protein [Selenomonadaceae bacterium]